MLRKSGRFFLVTIGGAIFLVTVTQTPFGWLLTLAGITSALFFGGLNAAKTMQIDVKSLAANTRNLLIAGFLVLAVFILVWLTQKIL